MDVTVAEEEQHPTDAGAECAIDLPALITRYREIAAVLALTGVGAFIRLWHLTTLPYGFHNDEGNVVIDAQRILHEGWIGPYSLLALGYPIAVNYFVAPFIKVFGAGVLGVRLPIALLGIACIPLAYYAFRLAAGWRVAVCGTFILAFSEWHLHLSRVGFPAMGWPFIEFGSLLLLQLGIQKQRWPYFVGAGLLIGVGTWVYNSAFLYAAAVGIYLVGWFVARNYRRLWGAVVSLRRGLPWDARPAREFLLLLILLASTLLAAWPLIRYAADPKHAYQNHFKSVYAFNQPAYKQDTTLVERVRVVARNSKDLFRWLTTEAHPDGADGVGAKPPVGRLTMYIAIVGAVIALWRYRNPAMGIALLSVPLIWIATALTIDGQYRRSFGVLPFIALFAGLALGVLWEWVDRRPVAVRAGALAVIVLALGAISYRNLTFYFRDYPHTSTARFVFFPEMREASEYLDGLGHPYVYMYSERASLGHESRRVLAPHIAGGEERSAEFGHDGKNVRFDLRPDANPSFPATVAPDGAFFLFMGRYTKDLETVEAKYPGGAVSEAYSERYKTYDYRAYYLPANLLDYYSRQEHVIIPVQPKK